VPAVIKVQIKLSVGNYIFSFTIHIVFVFVDSNSSVSVTIQNSTHVYINIFLTVTSTKTSKILTFPHASLCVNRGFVYKYCFALRCVEFSISPFHLGYPPEGVLFAYHEGAWGSGIIGLSILNHGIRGRLLFSLTPRQL